MIRAHRVGAGVVAALGILLLAADPAPRPAADPPPPSPPKDGTTVVVTQPDETNFPEIAVYFEVRKPDGSPLLDARRDEFRVTEDGQDRPIDGFEAPESVESRPTTLVLVIDRSRSMVQEDRIGGAKRAVGRFLDGLPRGSRVAVIAFGSDVSLIQPFTDQTAEVREAVAAIEPIGGTRYYDAVLAALELLSKETGRRAILALTDGEDTLSRQAAVPDLIREARRVGVPIHTLGLGSGEAVASGALAQLATATRGQAYSADNADQLRAIYEEIARRLGSTYRLTYQTDHRVPDGTLRPIQVFHQRAEKAGEAAVFIPGMVAPASGWSGLFLVLIGGLTALALRPTRRRVPTPAGKG